MRGWIALDIDGTITTDKYSVPMQVIFYLKNLSKEWQIFVLTGRTYAFASLALAKFDFPFLFSVQNGATILQMPEKKVVAKRYFTPQVIPVLEQAYEGIEGDFLIYAGFEKGDYCYWRPEGFPNKYHDYLKDLKTRQKEDWHAVAAFDPEHLEKFPLIKCVGTLESMMILAERLHSSQLFESTLIRDPFDKRYYLLMLTAKGVSKATALNMMIEQRGYRGKVIAAGDDNNDADMLAEADVSIAMPTAPENMRKSADYIAPPVEEFGVISILEKIVKDER